MGPRSCTGCGHGASERARFCERCGAGLTPGAEPLRAPSALEGKILGERAGIEGEHKQVTVMYADIVGSMDLTRLLDAERWGFVLDRFLGIAADAVHAHEGTVNQFTGDGLLAVFGAPLAHEDHARRACLAALEVQSKVLELAGEVQRNDGLAFAIRCGLNSGAVIVGAIGDDVHMDFVPVGTTTSLGKRIEEVAPAGSTAISASTAALVDGEFELSELGEFQLKGVPTPQRILELVALGPARTRLLAVATTRGLSRFVGRDAELATLESELDQALAGDGRSIGVVGDAGVGKSRLVHEFVANCVERGLPVSSANGVAHGRYAPFLPVLALCRDHFGIDDHHDAAAACNVVTSALLALDPTFEDELPLLFEFLGIAETQAPQTVPDPVAHRRRLLAAAIRALTARSPLEAAVLVLEDLHWFDDASDSFLEELTEALAGTRILLVTTYRAEYDDAWTTATPHARLALDPLDAEETEDLLGELLGRNPALATLASLIEDRSGGNPFFVEELVQALVENGRLTGDRGSYALTGEVAGLVLPATVQAALAARIDRLPPREKALVQTMSVVGQEISEQVLIQVTDLGERDLAEAMALLEHGQWVVTRDANLRREYVFKHPLTQEVAYESQLSRWRRDAHRRVASAIEKTYPDALDERAALLAQHCESSGDILDAAGWHARAGAWAEIASPAEGMRHWRRVRDLSVLLDPSPDREELAARSRVGILSLGWRLGIALEESAAIHAEAHEADGIERGRADLFHSGLLMHSGHERQGLEGFRAASRHAAATGDPGLILTAATGVAYASWVAGSLSEGTDALDRALLLVAGDPLVGSGLAFVCPLAHAYQTLGLCRGYRGELEQARRDFEQAIALARTYGDTETESAAHANQALLEAVVGLPETAVDLARHGLKTAERAENVVHVIANAVPLAVAEAGLGLTAEALAHAESALASLRQHRVGRYYEPVLLATIAQATLALGRDDKALTAAEQAAEIATSRGLGACALTAPITLARVLIAFGEVADGGRIDGVLSRALHVAHASDALALDPLIRREQVAAGRVWNDVTGHAVSS